VYSPQYYYVIIVSCAGIIYTAKLCYWIGNHLHKERREIEEKIEVNVDIKEGTIRRGKIKDRRM